MSNTYCCPTCNRQIPLLNEIVHNAKCIRLPVLLDPPVTDTVSSSSSSNQVSPDLDPESFEDDESWSCSNCTFKNPNRSSSICGMCGQARSLDRNDLNEDLPVEIYQEILDDDSVIEIEDDEPEFIGEKWNCSTCTFGNDVRNDYCEMCHNPRPQRPAYREQLLYGRPNGLQPSESNIFLESTIFGAGVGAGVAWLNGSSITRGALEGASIGAVGGLFMQSLRNDMLTAIDDDPYFDNNTFVQNANVNNSVSRDRLAQLPTRIYSSTTDTPQTCSICLENFKDRDSLRTLPCLHQFHVRCVDQWLQKSLLCPVCKYKIM